MKLIMLIFMVLPMFVSAQSPADKYFDASAMASARNAMQASSGNTTNYLIMGERLESLFDDGEQSLAWEGQGWMGKDLNRVWIKTEGHNSGGKGLDFQDKVELQLLYSHALNPFWDVQLGLRHDFISEDDLNYAVFGIQGLAPHWFEVDMATFVSESGKVSSRLEVEYDIVFTQRLILQPRFELNYSFNRDAEINLGKGVSETSFGLRLRYEFKRNFAPYIGLNWQGSFGESADLLERVGAEAKEFSVLAGIRFWY